MSLITFAAISLAIWVYLIALRGDFWRVSRNMDEPTTPSRSLLRKVIAVIPARNEAPGIGEAVGSLVNQDSAAPVEVVVVDDGSTDGTPEIARAAAEREGKLSRLTVIKAPPLQSGWTGKLWALSQGIAYAERLNPDYLLFTDGDIRHERGNVRMLIGRAEGGNYELISYMVKLACISPAEKALIPAFVYFFLQLYPPKWIQSATSRVAAAAGGCILIRPKALARIGGISAIRGETIDDCALARAIKGNGGRVWMGLTDSAQSLRSYGGCAEIAQMISRNAFNQLRHSLPLLAVTIVALFFTYLLPPLLLFTGALVPVILGAIAYSLMTFSYLPMLRFYRRSPAWALALPLIAVFYLGATVHSAIQYWRGRGGEWKGRVQDARIR